MPRRKLEKWATYMLSKEILQLYSNAFKSEGPESLIRRIAQQIILVEHYEQEEIVKVVSEFLKLAVCFEGNQQGFISYDELLANLEAVIGQSQHVLLEEQAKVILIALQKIQE